LTASFQRCDVGHGQGDMKYSRKQEHKIHTANCHFCVVKFFTAAMAIARFLLLAFLSITQLHTVSSFLSSPNFMTAVTGIGRSTTLSSFQPSQRVMTAILVLILFIAFQNLIGIL
jgi:hypothetical protein